MILLLPFLLFNSSQEKVIVFLIRLNNVLILGIRKIPRQQATRNYRDWRSAGWALHKIWDQEGRCCNLLSSEQVSINLFSNMFEPVRLLSSILVLKHSL